MGIFTDGDDEEDELFDLYMLNEIHEGSNKGGSTMIIPGLSEPPVRTLRATIPENESHIFR